jgi:hypothetical protein
MFKKDELDGPTTRVFMKRKRLRSHFACAVFAIRPRDHHTTELAHPGCGGRAPQPEPPASQPRPADAVEADRRLLSTAPGLICQISTRRPNPCTPITG